MLRFSRAAILGLAAALVLTACSSASPTAPSAPEVSVPAATGPEITGTGYSYSVPEGWAVPPDGTAPGADTIAADLTDDDGFVDNVNVLLSPAGEVTSEQVESQGVDELEGAGAEDVAIRDRITVAGSESAHLSAALSTSGVEYEIEQFYVTSEGQTYVVTFSVSPSVSEADRDELYGSVLASWTWE